MSDYVIRGRCWICGDGARGIRCCSCGRIARSSHAGSARMCHERGLCGHNAEPPAMTPTRAVKHRAGCKKAWEKTKSLRGLS